MRQTALIFATLLATVFTSVPALAAWKLDNSHSQLSFISVKKGTVAETHHFTSFQGTMDEHAKVNVQCGPNECKHQYCCS